MDCMADATIYPGKISGTLCAMASKSYTHRAVIAAALAEGKSVIENALDSDDTAATIEAMQALGAKIKWAGKAKLLVTGIDIRKAFAKEPINCRNSGSTMRFLIPLLALARRASVLDAYEGLRKRPMGPVIGALATVRIDSNGGYPPLKIHPGKLPALIKIGGNTSSQFITGLLFALPLEESDSKIIITTELESRPYIDITLDVLKEFGIEVKHTDDFRKFEIAGGQAYAPKKYRIHSDFSGMAFPLVAGAIAGNVTVTGVTFRTKQGDRKIIGILKQMGADISLDKKRGSIAVSCKKGLGAVKIDAGDIPDLVPVLAVACAYARGMSLIYNAGRLRIKESDRLNAIAEGLKKMGAKVIEKLDSLEIEGGNQLRGAEVDSCNDHRIAMALAVAALGAEGKTVIRGAECVAKSYPNFFLDLKRLGAKVEG